MEVHLPIFRGSCSIFDLMQILLIIWIAVLMHSVFCNIFFYFRKQISLTITELALVLSLYHLDFRLFTFGSHSWNQDEFTVRLFQSWSSSFYFSRKLFKFWAHENSLDHLYFSNCALAVFYNEFFISGSKFLIQSLKAVVNNWNLRLC